MNISNIDIDAINPAPYNPRKDLQPADREYQKLKRSIEEFGMVEPVVWNSKTGNLVGGHQRFKVLKELGHKAVLSVVVDLDDKKEKALNIALNKISGEWDYPKLKDILVDLDDGSFDLSLTGFDEIELKDLIDFQKSIGGGGTENEDEVPDVPATTRTKRGDVFILGDHRLICGDSTNKGDLSKLFGNESATFCFTSPPYSDQRVYAEGQEISPAYLSAFLLVASERCELFAVNLGLSRKDNEVVTYWDQYIQTARKAGLKLLSWNVWDKKETGSIGNQTAMFGIQHEWILIFGEKRRALNRTIPNKHYGERGHGSTREKDGSLTPANKTFIGKYKQLPTVISLFAVKARNNEFDHPAMFPVELPRTYIEACTQERDVVFEPFGGSGSTLIACEELNRQCRIIELEPKFCDVIVERWEQFTGKKASLFNGKLTGDAYAAVPSR